MATERRPLPIRGESRSQVDVVADQLLGMYLDPQAQEMQHIGSYELPSERQVESIVEQCRALLFPGYAGSDVDRGAPSALRDTIRARVIELRLALHRQVYRAAHHKRQQQLGRSTSSASSAPTRPIRSPIASSFTFPSCAGRSRSICTPRTRAIRRPPASTKILLCYPGRTRSRCTGWRTCCCGRAPW